MYMPMRHMQKKDNRKYVHAHASYAKKDNRKYVMWRLIHSDSFVHILLIILLKTRPL